MILTVLKINRDINITGLSPVFLGFGLIAYTRHPAGQLQLRPGIKTNPHRLTFAQLSHIHFIEPGSDVQIAGISSTLNPRCTESPSRIFWRVQG